MYEPIFKIKCFLTIERFKRYYNYYIKHNIYNFLFVCIVSVWQQIKYGKHS